MCVCVGGGGVAIKGRRNLVIRDCFLINFEEF